MHSFVSVVVSAFHKIVVVGGGPGGSIAALQLNKLGHDCLLLDKSEFPKDKICGESVDGYAIKLLNEIDPSIYQALNTDKSLASHRIRISNSKGKFIQVSYPSSAYPRTMITRKFMDEVLINKAKQAHRITVKENAEVVSASRTTDQWKLQLADDSTVKCEVLIWAAGSRHKLTKMLRGDDPNEQPTFVYVRQHFHGVNHEALANAMEVHVGVQPIPYYVTMSKVGHGVTTIILAAKASQLKSTGMTMVDLLDHATKTHPSLIGRFDSASAQGTHLGSYLNSGSIDNQYARDGLLLVGDAGGVLNPITGYGVMNAMLTGKMAADAAAAGINTGDLSAQLLNAQINSANAYHLKMRKVSNMTYKACHQLGKYDRLFGFWLTRKILSWFDAKITAGSI